MAFNLQNNDFELSRRKCNHSTVNSVWPQTSGFHNSPKLTTFGIFSELLSTQILNVARFARSVEWDFFFDFQTLCVNQ